MLPYSLSTPVFPFRALAALAGRLPLGGERELALAAFMAARLASGSLPPHPLSAAARQHRATAARVWFSTLALLPAARTPIARLVEATEREDPRTTAAALTDVVAIAAPILDRGARTELAELVAALEAIPQTAAPQSALS
jgi:hypothetical protein